MIFSARSFWRRLWADQRGQVVVITAVVLPMLAMGAVGAIELSFLSSDRAKLQEVADSAALAGAHELTLAGQTGAPNRAELYADEQLAGLRTRSEIVVAAQVLKKGDAIQVDIDAHRASFFGSLLPPGGFKTHVRAVAERMGHTPLCVLSSNVDPSSGVKITQTSQLTAGACLVHSNSTINVDSSAWLQAAAVQSVGESRGRISPSAMVGAAKIDDPFAGLDLSIPPLCSSGLITTTLLILGVPVAPGAHCGKIIVSAGQTLNLMKGEHYFKNGDVELRKGSKLAGSDVVLIFDNQSKLSAKDDAQIELEGRKSGKFAGFVIMTTHDSNQTFDISTDSARKLLGTIYVPNAILQIAGTGNKVADQSPWTVIVAKSIEMVGSPDLVINANYTSSNVPVPEGVGPVTNVKLVD